MAALDEHDVAKRTNNEEADHQHEVARSPERPPAIAVPGLKSLKERRRDRTPTPEERAALFQAMRAPTQYPLSFEQVATGSVEDARNQISVFEKLDAVKYTRNGESIDFPRDTYENAQGERVANVYVKGPNQSAVKEHLIAALQKLGYDVIHVEPFSEA